MAKKAALQISYEAAIEKGLISESAAERTQALRSAGDLLSPALGELAARAKAAEDRLDEAKNSLKEITAERDTLLPLQIIADKVGPLQEQLDKVLAEQNEWKAEQTRLLTGEVTQKLFAAQATLRDANATMAEAQSRFGQAGLQLLLDEVQKLITQHNIVEPDPASLPAGISSMLLTLWNHTPAYASVALSYAQSFREPSDNFKQTLLRVMMAGLPTYEGMPQSDPIENLGVKREVLTSMATKWNVLSEVQRQFDSIQIQRQGQFLLNNNLQLAVQEDWQKRTGATMEEQTRTVQSSVTGCPLSEHVLGCPCHLCGGREIHSNSMDEII
jgi:hypothetical protein